MTVEAEVRRSLLQWADEVHPAPPRAGAVARRVAVRRRRRVARGIGVVAVVAAGAVFANVTWRTDDTTSVRTASGGGGGGGSGSASASGSLGDPALFVLDPPWTLTYGMMGLDLDGAPPTYTTDLRFEQADQTVEIVSYRQGSRTDQGDSEPQIDDSLLRGVRGMTLRHGPQGFRIVWDEGGQTLEATGDGFNAASDLAAVLDGMRVVDEAAFVAGLPDGVGHGLLVGVRSFPLDVAGYVNWTAGAGVTCNIDGPGSTGPHPVDPVTGC